jgi:hypothetical protein
MEPLKLGSLLMFRKAIENYLEFEQPGQASLNFIHKNLVSESSICLIKKIFEDTDYTIKFATENTDDQIGVLQGSFNYYSTWSGIDNQISRGRGKQELNWIKDHDIAFDDHVTCHLRVQREDECKEIFHAQINEWCNFFKLKKDQKFLLLGDDPYPSEILHLENIETAKDFDLDLNQQLSVIGVSKAFCGSASGFAAAAVLSSVPFLIFKHPDHHPWEDINPKFLEANQKQVRQIDTLENILQGLKFD